MHLIDTELLRAHGLVRVGPTDGHSYGASSSSAGDGLYRAISLALFGPQAAEGERGSELVCHLRGLAGDAIEADGLFRDEEAQAGAAVFLRRAATEDGGAAKASSLEEFCR
jgi:hypothetical protein